MSLCCRDIMPLSFIKNGTDRTRVQGIMNVVFLSALSRSNLFPRIRIAFPLWISISHVIILRRSANVETGGQLFEGHGGCADFTHDDARGIVRQLRG
jgi:hypothetical protein